ncbi:MULTISPECIES: methylmalonyl-CoA mutase subunit beta [unclassified Beijerinckia]|uniref:methylmalonyl-CoA mutase subunit beta n=1 Tax=unclassified Beijerinckia TaxID=2638183 RepID=UPI00089A42CB|nr:MULTISPECIES: methylmalonyl-CoA mutase subunit beta [unclassified Beijerinckia]MDH7796490.1 methylmalonyl-CoA mutase [Beijerinckia sp. GAS462]SEC47335.1 heterodimeric methylmalonyl-CoA mutase small subunit [Beijerinckia sp. 28-YEA-48]
MTGPTDSITFAPLAAPFAGPGEGEWHALVEKVLKGKSFDKLVSHTADGIAYGPLTQRATQAGPRALRAAHGQWQVMARIEHPDADIANAQALEALINGASGLHLVMAGAAGAHGFGLSVAHLAQALKGVDLAGAAIEVDAGAVGEAVARTLVRLVAEQGLEPSLTRISFGVDPIGLAARGEETSPLHSLGPLATDLVALGFRGPLCVADGRIVHQAGGSEAQELAYALSTGIAYLRTLETAGLDLETARQLIGFRLAADADEFITIAKLRALRSLWAQVESACGLAPRPLHLHAETAWRMMTRRDPWVNVLRATTAVFSAAVAGADAISVLPHTQALGLPDAEAQRLARNAQLVLMEESNLAKVDDPAAGSGAFEEIGAALAQKAWTLLQEIEGEGGILSTLASGKLREAVAQVRAQRFKNIARRREQITGTSEFPNIHEAPAHVLLPLSAAAASGDMDATGLSPIRLAVPFERLRDTAEAFKTSHGQAPKIFLANLGTVAAFTGRATWARNFFEASGLETIASRPLATITDAARAFADSGAPIACLCSSDTVYAEQAAAVATALKQAGACQIWLAGQPAALEPELRAAGISDFAFAGCDMIEALARALTAAISAK